MELELINGHEFLMWIAIIGLVIAATFTGMYINRLFTYRAHRRALEELRQRAIDSARFHAAERRARAEVSARAVTHQAN